AEQTAKTLNDDLGNLNQAISAANSAKSTPNYTEADPDKQKALDVALSAAKTAKTSNEPSAVEQATTDLKAAQSGLNGDANTKKQAEQNID
ncbi:FIVAR domain-containing protein, partial [Lactobacillus kitasatonis]